MQRIPGTQLGFSGDNRRGSEHVLPFNRKHLIHDTQQNVACGLNCLTTLDGSVTVQNLLEDCNSFKDISRRQGLNQGVQ